MKPATTPNEPRNQPPRRRFRLWEKKRGNHQTGSSWWGRAGEVLFFSALFLVGVFLLSQLVTWKYIAEHDTFLTSHLGFTLGAVILASLIITGAAGSIYSAMLTSTSAERRAALVQRASRPQAELSRATKTGVHSKEKYPTIPSDADWKISPGVSLDYRLPANSGDAVRLASLAIFALVWNAAVVVLAVIEFNLAGQASNKLIREWLSKPGFNLTGLVLAGFAGIGIYCVYCLSRTLLAAEAMGPTQLEVCSQPLLPGSRYQVAITQLGHLKIKQLEVWLACDEEVLFSEGTDTRSEVRRIYEQPVFKKENIAIEPSEPYQYRDSLELPEDAMHSFVSPHNSITWKLVVKATPQRWPPLERTFPLIVHPQPLHVLASAARS